MELYVFDGNRQLSGIIEAYEYLRWTRRYSGCGGFELKALVTPENIALLKEGNILRKSDDEEAGIIERVELSQLDREIITANGRFATSFLARRIIWDTEHLFGDLSACVGQLLEHNMLNPADADRKITGFAYSAPTLGVNISSQVSHRNLLEVISELCDAAEVGIKTIFDPRTGLLTITLYAGGASDAVFSKEYENLTEQTYTESVAEYANTALIGGEGEGSDRTFVTITQGSGEDRREVFVDAKDLRSEDFPDNYADALTFRGQSRLSELAPHYSFDADVNPHGNLHYKTDFDLGNLVKIISKPWGVTMTARITEIEETYDSGGQSLTLTFGKSELTLAQKMRSDMSGMKTALLAVPGGGSGEIPDASVTAAKLADNAVTSAKIASGAVATSELSTAAVTAEKISTGAVSTAKIADSAVTAAKIASGAVTTAKMAQEADTAITITWASGVSLAGIQNSYVNKGVVCLGFQILVSTAIAPGGTMLTITDANFRPYTTVRSALIPVPTFVTSVPITIESNGVLKNAASGTTLPTGYYIVSVTYARA